MGRRGTPERDAEQGAAPADDEIERLGATPKHAGKRGRPEFRPRRSARSRSPSRSPALSAALPGPPARSARREGRAGALGGELGEPGPFEAPVEM